MREQKWLTSSSIHNMLRLVRGEPVGFFAMFGWRQAQVRRQPQFRASERQLRLFACACCRRIERLLTDKRLLQGVEAIEQLADGYRQREELESVFGAVEQIYQEHLGRYGQSRRIVGAPAIWTLVDWQPDQSEYGTCQPETMTANLTAYEVGLGGNFNRDAEGWRAESREHQAQCHLLRDIVGNPFRPVTIPASVLVWNDCTIPRIAQGIYDERAFNRLPILADALEDAGCDNADILKHCRQPGEHLRGCWALDLLLGKN
jgi:hypothetical protein